MTSISEICGFSNPSAFNKFFKKEYNCTPTAYREKHKDVEKKKSFYDNSNLSDKLKKWKSKNIISKEKKADSIYQKINCGKVIFSREQSAVHSIDFDLASDLLYSENQTQLLSMKRDFGIKFVRIGGIFHRDMFFMINANPHCYNFDNINRVLDFLTKNELIPIIDLTMRQKSSYRDIGTSLYDDNNEPIIFSNIDDWVRTLKVFVHHILFRYGKECVANWYFELDESESYQNFCKMHGIEDISYRQLCRREILNSNILSNLN